MNFSRNAALWIIIVLLLFALFNFFQSNMSRGPQQDIPYSVFLDNVQSGQVNNVTIQGSEITGIDSNGRTFSTRATDTLDGLVPTLREGGVTFTVKPVDNNNTLLNILITWFPMLLLIGVWIFFMRQMQGGGGKAMGFGKSKARLLTEKVGRVTFDDVAGIDEAKQELEEVVEFLRDPQKFQRLGGKIPKGCLLVGPPGTGKTLLARAIAGEANVPFFTISGSDFVEMFVGVGASRVRDMFEQAKKNAPCIIFIDEIEAVGRHRGAGLGGGNDEREQTLNQILAEMDGFSGHEAVIILAATNRPDVLDPALLRPGRFDRHVTLELPDREAREAILKVHTKSMPLAPDVDLKTLASATPGFSGADLKNLVNEAAMAAARAGAHAIDMRNFDEMRDKVMMGTVRSLAIRPDERHRLAVHEAGHTVVAHFLPTADPIYKVTIIPRGRALGGTHMLPEEERHTLPEDYLKDRLAVMLGGRTAEKVLLGNVSSGADDDIKKATQMARAMVSRWGMSEEIGPVDLRQSEDHPFLGREIAQRRRFSETTAHDVDAAVSDLLREAEARAEAIITENKAGMNSLVQRLEERETLSAEEVNACLGGAKARGSAA